CPHPYLPSFPTRRSSDLLEISVLAPNFDDIPPPTLRGAANAIQLEFDDHERGNSKGNPGLPDRGEATAAPHDPFVVFQQGNFPRSEEHTSELQSRGHLVC